MVHPECKRAEADRAKAPGASRSMPGSADTQGPLGLVQLRGELAQRLQSVCGRPTNPAWTVRRIVPFRIAGWAELQEFAARLIGQGVR